MNTLAHDDAPFYQTPQPGSAPQLGPISQPSSAVPLGPTQGADAVIRHSVIVPVFNEEAVLPVTYQRLKAVMETTEGPYEIIFVNDGSADKSRELLESFREQDDTVQVLHFSRNFGHQVAITAGMDHARGDAIIVIDADLQDPPELISAMIARWQQGYEVVYAKRTMRRGESWFKRWTAASFYRALRFLTDVEIPVDTGDFRLIDRKVCDVLKGIHEKNRFVRGLVAWTGFRQAAVEYVREPRAAGESKYPLRKMLRLAMDAVTSFSDKPLRLATYLGGGLLTLSLVSFLAILVDCLFFHHAWSVAWMLSVLIVFCNSLVLLVLGILGQYLSRIHEETRHRPLYILDGGGLSHGEQLGGGRARGNGEHG